GRRLEPDICHPRRLRRQPLRLVSVHFRLRRRLHRQRNQDHGRGHTILTPTYRPAPCRHTPAQPTPGDRAPGPPVLPHASAGERPLIVQSPASRCSPRPPRRTSIVGCAGTYVTGGGPLPARSASRKFLSRVF